MTLSTLPLSYCTNVHPGLTVSQIQSGLQNYTLPIRERFQRPLAAGLWLAAPVIHELKSSDDAIRHFCEHLSSLGLTCHTLNAFPYGNFHSERVKDSVYIPDWTTQARFDYTRDCATVLATMLAPSGEGSISTVPLGFKRHVQSDSFLDECSDRLVELAIELDGLRTRTGKTIRLAIEPEPLCVLETTPETIAFFERLWQRAARTGRESIAREFLGCCYDICHQSVEFEDVVESIQQLAQAGIRMNKFHISCALQVDDPRNGEAREALSRYAEQRYLHQTFAKLRSGRVVSIEDLSSEFTRQPPAEFLDAERWRIHFHVPVDAERLGPLSTTRPDLIRALGAVAKLDYAPHLEVETYTWEVLPDGKRVGMIDGFGRELTATANLIQSIHSA